MPDARALRLACRLIKIKRDGGILPQALGVLTHCVSCQLGEMCQNGMVNEWSAECRQLAEQSALRARLSVPRRPLNELLVETGRAFAVATMHFQKGCPNAADCLYCVE